MTSSPSSRRGVFVLDCGDLSAAYCGRVLAGLGATVVRRRTLESWRVGNAAARSFYGRGVRTSAGEADGPLTDRDLAAVDVLLTSGRPSELRAAGLDYATVSRGREDLVVVNISPFGLDGPRAEWRASNLVACAAGGMVYVNGWPEEAPLQPLGLQAYHAAGIHAAIGALLALRARDRCGRGQLVDISMQESVVASVEHVTGMLREGGTVAGRTGTLHWTRSFRAVPARDGEVLVSYLGDWDALSAWVAAECDHSTLRDERWRSLDYRRDHCEELFDEIARWSSRYGAAELVGHAQLRRLPFAPVSNLTNAANHPQLEARFFFETTDQPGEPPKTLRRPLALPSLEAALADLPRTSKPDSRLSTLDSRPRIPDPRSHSPALAGVRVLDLTWVVAGPVATRVLADHGAEVIKVEHPATATPGPRRGGLFGNLNRGKKSVVLDLADPTGIERLQRLIAACDVLVENFSPRVLSNWGLDDAALHRIQPELIAVHMSGFGRSGPLRDWVSYGPTLQSQLGFTAHMRHAGQPSAGLGYSYSDMASGYVAALAVVAALQAGGPRIVDLAQLEVLATMVGPALVEAANGGSIPAALGNTSQEGVMAPHGIYRCRDAERAPRDRWCAIAVGDDAQWGRLRVATALDLPDLAALDEAAARQRRAGEIDRAVERWTRARPVESVVSTLQNAGVPAAVVADAQDLLEDEHLRERAMWTQLATEDGIVELDASPIRLSATPGAIRAPGPRLDEHGEEILRRLVDRSQENEISATDEHR